MTFRVLPIRSGPGPVNLFNRMGTQAAPLESLAGAIGANTLFGTGTNDIVIPFESLYPGWRAKIDCYIEHSGTAGTLGNCMLKGNLTTRSASGTTLNNLNTGAGDATGAHLGLFLYWDGAKLCFPNNSAGITAIVTKNNVTLTAGQSYVISPAIQTISAGDTAKLLWLSMDRLY